MFVLGNTAALWGLLSVPALVLIYALRPKPKVVVATTLFLLSAANAKAREGVRLRRPRFPLPFWLQLLGCLLLVWLLADPRWVRAEGSQTIALVLDASASMQACRDETRARLVEIEARLARSVRHTEWVLLETDPSAGTLARGDFPAVLDAFARWTPVLGTHDVVPTLRTASRLVRGAGQVLLLTDRPEEVRDAEATVVGVGVPKPNAFIASAEVVWMDGRPRWHVLAGAHGAVVGGERRSLRIQMSDTATTVAELVLEDGLRSIEGDWPAGVESLTLALSPADALPLDDTAPLVLPRPRVLLVAPPAGDGGAAAYFRRVVAALPALESPAEGKPVQLALSRGDRPTSVRERAEIRLPKVSTEAAAGLVRASVLAVRHPLVNDIDWQGFLAPGPGEWRPAETDNTLLWQAGKPLAWVVGSGARAALVLNFDWENSNADRLPAFLVLFQRFIEQVRAETDGASAVNVDTLQSLGLRESLAHGAPALEWTVGSAKSQPVLAESLPALRAPREPGLFFLRTTGDGARTVLAGAARFADPRESDLTGASSQGGTEALDALASASFASLQPDPFRPLWVLLVLACALASWALSAGRGAHSKEASAP